MIRRGAVVAAAFALFASHPAVGSAQEPTGDPDRGGFTVLVTGGFGYQDDRALAKAQTGLAGVNLGIGGFVSDELVLWFRASATSVNHRRFPQTSGVGVAGIQYWLDERLSVEGGVGVGFWDIPGFRNVGLGMLLGARYAVFNWGKHSLQLGFEYGAAVTSPDTVHNLGLTLGYQLT